MLIRECVPSDFDGVWGLLRQLWPEKALDTERARYVFERYTDAGEQAALCACEGEKVLGFCSFSCKQSLWKQGKLAYVDELVVDEACRGMGIGAELLGRVEGLAREKGCVVVELDSAFHREGAHRFYLVRGYEKRAFLFTKDLTDGHSPPRG